MAYDTLSVVNSMLALLGESPVADLEAPHPALPGARAKLRDYTELIQAERWWFNTEYSTLTPQVGNGRMVLPGDTASADLLTRYPNTTVRGTYLYNNTDGTYVFTKPVKVRLHRIIPFDELPLSARRYIAAYACLMFQNTIDADANKTRLLEKDERMAYSLMNAEHIRNTRSNMLHRPGVARLLNVMQGESPFEARIKY